MVTSLYDCAYSGVVMYKMVVASIISIPFLFMFLFIWVRFISVHTIMSL